MRSEPRRPRISTLAASEIEHVPVAEVGCTDVESFCTRASAPRAQISRTIEGVPIRNHGLRQFAADHGHTNPEV